MNLSQLRRAVWLRRLSDACQSRFTLLKNHHRLGWLATLAFASAGLLHPHVPFDEAANLTLGIAPSQHARDKLAVLLFGIAVFRAKRDNGRRSSTCEIPSSHVHPPIRPISSRPFISISP